MLQPEIKRQISCSYSRLRTSISDFVPRKAQNFLIAELAKTLAGEYQQENRILVAEAGTGIGKSLAYLLGSIPYALFNHKKIVISTATLSLQQQLFDKDFPLFKQIFAADCNIALAKGRQRYCCAHKLALLANANAEQETSPMLFDFVPKKSDFALYQKLHSAFSTGAWDGSRDNWSAPISDAHWQAIVSDKHSCHAGLHSHRHCPFTRAREQISKADIVITNHSLLIADLELGGGVILFEPEKTIYIIDEAHHLPSIARDFSALSLSLVGTANWLEKLNKAASKLATAASISQRDNLLTSLQTQLQQLIPSLRQLRAQLEVFAFNQENTYRFAHGELPESMVSEVEKLKIASNKTLRIVKKLHDHLLEQHRLNNLPKKHAEALLEESAHFLSRTETLASLWEQMAKPSPEKGAPYARWIERNPENKKDIWLHVSPIEVGARLKQQLWSKAAGVGLFSATLRALNKFEYFCRQVGLDESNGTQFIALPSPFDFSQNAQLRIAKTSCEPQDEAFTKALPELILRYLKDQQASLVLFSSYWQMNEVAAQIKTEIKKMNATLLVQGKKARHQLIEEHIALCKKGKSSILFGTSSFSEGLDLPGNLLTNLIITKIPFSVPTSPIEEAHAEYIEQQGGNAFVQISLPETSRKLIQSVGRLLRKEKDMGQIVILDRRLVSKGYGKPLLNALPPFRLVIE